LAAVVKAPRFGRHRQRAIVGIGLDAEPDGENARNDRYRAVVQMSQHAMNPPPSITFHVAGQLREYCGGASELSIAAHTVRAALEDLERNQAALYRNVCDETGAVRKHLNVFVNSDNIRDLNGVDTTLTPGDVVTILPAVSGG
jgi:sulfur-carrier protein